VPSGARGQKDRLGTVALGLHFNLLGLTEQVLLFLEVVVIHILRVVVVVALGHHRGLIHPSAEVARLEGGALRGREAGRGVRVRPEGVLPREELSSHFSVALRHEVLVDEATALARVAGDVLLADLVSGAADPVHCVLRAAPVHVGVDVLAGGQLSHLLLVASQLEHVKLVGVATGLADLAVDRT